MATVFIIVLVLTTTLAAGTAPVCIDGWKTYRDELCIKTFSTLETYEGAKEFCSSQSEEGSLVMVKESELQQLLANVTQGTFDNIWLGSKYDQQSEQFRWEDGEPLTFTNWQDGYPRVIDNSDSCIELRPFDGKKEATGKWADVTCQKRNLVMCQKPLLWSFQDAVGEIIKLRKQLEEAKAKIEESSVKIEELEEASLLIVPVGSTYVEYSNQPSPATLWPSLTWEDVTNEYAGLFFRAYGSGSSAEWGATQSECAPRITQVQYTWSNEEEFIHRIDVPERGWSPYVAAGAFGSYTVYEGLRYHTDGCEVRPKNQAIRIWKRIA